jgi:hypothetical protein
MSPSTRTPRWSESPFTPGTSQVTIDDVGTYRVQFVISGIEANQFALFHNGTAIPGSVYGSGSGTGETGDVIVPLAAGDVPQSATTPLPAPSRCRRWPAGHRPMSTHR